MDLEARLDKPNDSGRRDHHSPRTGDTLANVYAEDIQRFGYKYWLCHGHGHGARGAKR